MKFLVANSLICILSAQNNQQEWMNKANEMVDHLNNVNPGLINQVTSIAQSVASNQPQASNIASSIVASASSHYTDNSHRHEHSSLGTATVGSLSTSLSISSLSSVSSASTDSPVTSPFIALSLISFVSYLFY